MDLLKQEWVVKNGSIETKETKRRKTPSGDFVNEPVYVAFNLGDLAHHIARLHNESLKK